MALAETILEIIKPEVTVTGETVSLREEGRLTPRLIDELTLKAVFGSQSEKASARYLIRELAGLAGVWPASIHEFYRARGAGKVEAGFSTPAVNIRGMAYDTARAVFKKAGELRVGAFILEIARSEMEYTGQSPEEYASVILAAALRESFRGPVFIQGDHFQVKPGENPGEPKAGEIEELERLIAESVKAGFYNLDLDTSTLVDLTRESEAEQQENNITYSRKLFKRVRQEEPKGLTISVGGEIGHIGGKNSTPADFRAFMEGFMMDKPLEMEGLSKISVQTGTSHGGVVQPDGSLKKVEVDFRVLEEISKAAREEYGMAGAVQHGASTLPRELFAEFPKSGTAEVHLATGFQNLLFDHPEFPPELRQEIYVWLDREKSGEKKPGWTEEQFHYKLRKKGLGKFKREIWEIAEGRRAKIRESIEEEMDFLFKALGVVNSQGLVEKWVKPRQVKKELADFEG